MKGIIVGYLLCVVSCFGAFSQTRDAQEVVVECNKIMKDIYNDIWRIREDYRELRTFGRDNLFNTVEMPTHFQAIKCIRFTGTKEKTGLGGPGMPGDNDIMYICFSDDARAYGTFQDPKLSIYVKRVGLYLLVYSKTSNRYIERALINIVKRHGLPPQ